MTECKTKMNTNKTGRVSASRIPITSGVRHAISVPNNIALIRRETVVERINDEVYVYNQMLGTPAYSGK